MRRERRDSSEKRETSRMPSVYERWNLGCVGLGWVALGWVRFGSAPLLWVRFGSVRFAPKRSVRISFSRFSCVRFISFRFCEMYAPRSSAPTFFHIIHCLLIVAAGWRCYIPLSSYGSLLVASCRAAATVCNRPQYVPEGKGVAGQLPPPPPR